MMCSQMHGMVLVNAHGEPKSNAITWQDQRGALPVPGERDVSYVEWIASRLPPKLQEALGNELRPGIPIATLAWLAREGDLPSGELSVNVATGPQVSALSEGFLPGEWGKCQVRPFFDRLFLHTVTHIPAGRSLNVLMRLLGELPSRAGSPLQNPWELVQRAVAETDSTDLDVDLSFFDNRTARTGAVRNISEHNLTVGHLFRAALERMANDYCGHADALPMPEGGWKRLVFSGGIADGLPFLRELIESRLCVPSRVSSIHEHTMNGLLVLGLRSSGRAECLEAAMHLVASHERGFKQES